jgi:hypothetical protein
MHEKIKIEGSVHGDHSLKASPMKEQEQEERRKNEHKYDKSFKFVSKQIVVLRKPSAPQPA